MTERTLVDYLEDIVQASRQAIRFLDMMSITDLEKDDKTEFAVVRALQIIGEASRHISQETQDRYPNVAWRNMIGMRNILVHNYATVDLTVVHNSITHDLPPLITAVEVMLPTCSRSTFPKASRVLRSPAGGRFGRRRCGSMSGPPTILRCGGRPHRFANRGPGTARGRPDRARR